MAKPLGIVAMLVLLSTSGTALASEKIFTKRIDIWAVTNTGNLYLETKAGEKYIAPMHNCSTSIIKNFEEPNLHMGGRFVRPGKIINVYDAGTKRGENVRCKLGEVSKLT